jgi:hypothetical protein
MGDVVVVAVADGLELIRRDVDDAIAARFGG